jgi:hypothetical protein
MSEFQNFKPRQLAPGERFGAYLLTGRSPLVNYGWRDGVAAINTWDEMAEHDLRVGGILPELTAYIVGLGRVVK